MDELTQRILARDYTVWKDDPTEIADRLGWLDLPSIMPSVVDELVDVAEEAAYDGYKHAVLLGMGGSSLAPEVLRTTLGVARGALELTVMDSTHPAAISSLTATLDLPHTLFIVASKSGTTLETLSHLEYFYELAEQNGDQFIAITDPGSDLDGIGEVRGFRTVFGNPRDIGGRYSALSYFGLVPAAMIGADLNQLLDSAREVANSPDPGTSLGRQIGEAAKAGRNKLTFDLPSSMSSFGSWVEQLIAESTGKEGSGILPVVGEDHGAPEVYGADREFVSIDAKPDQLGAEFFRWEFATAVAGHVLGIHPFDQPNVAEAKAATAEALKAGAMIDEPLGDVRALLQRVVPGDYVALQAFLEPSAENAAALQRARMKIRDTQKVATTVGFGPRYLHSTGQLHKGGPASGVFIQIVDAERNVDVSIPGAPYSFGALIDAQAAGDMTALRARGRRIVRTTLARLEEALVQQ